MSEEPTLDAVGPIFIISVVGIFTAIAVWLALDFNSGWGTTEPAVAATTVEDGR